MAYIPSDLRQFARERAGYCCEYCRLPESAGTVTFHIEHVIAVSHGGLTDEDNLAYSCSICNHYKGPNIAAADPKRATPRSCTIPVAIDGTITLTSTTPS
jgi:5-methylcytosine-specific restriction endonuclease McrA